jgi:accessory gene regulator protein AgrB
MRWPALLTEPLEGKTSLNRVFWLYGVVGSLLYGALEFFLDAGNALVMRLYIIGGLILSVYVAVATYRCAGNCRSKVWTRMAQASAILSLLLLPLIAYLELSGALDLAMNGLL